MIISVNMSKTKRSFSFFIIMLFFITIMGVVSSVSAADFVVNNTTSHNDIDNWMKSNTTVKGDSLLFNVSNYELSDTIGVSKPINIKSNIKTQISFNRNKPIFNISSSGINFSNLILNYNTSGNSSLWKSAIYSNSSSSKIVNINDISINLNGNYLSAIFIRNWVGNISNVNIIANGIYSDCISADYLIGNFRNVSLILNKKYSLGIEILKWVGNISNSKIVVNNNNSIGIGSNNWIGNLHNTNISTKGLLTYGVFAEKWTGKVSNSKIYSDGYRTIGFYSNSSTKGTIINSVISANKGIGIMISKNVKVYSTKSISIKGQDNIYVFGPILEIMRIYKYTVASRNYYLKIYNYGETNSKTSYLTVKIGKYKKTIKFKAVRPNKYVLAKIVLPKKYSNKKYWKSAKVTYYKGNGKKTSSKSLKFKF